MRLHGSGARRRRSPLIPSGVYSAQTCDYGHRNPARARGHVLRLLRRPDRARPQQARRGRGDGQPRDRAGDRRAAAPERDRRRRSSARSRRAGYHAPPGDPGREAAHDHDEPLATLARRLLVAAALTVPVALLAMVPPLQFAGWEWLALALATPGRLLVAAAGFHRAALNAAPARRRDDGHAGLDRHARRLDSGRRVVLVGGLDADTYFEVAAAITTLILLGRYLEARAKRRSRRGDPRGCSSWARRRRASCATASEVLVPVEELRPGDRFVVRPGEKIATDGVVEEGASAVDQSLLTGESVPVEVGAGQRGRRARRSTPTAGSSSARRGSAPRPRSRRSRGSSTRRSRARRRCSGSPTGSRRSSCRS